MDFTEKLYQKLGVFIIYLFLLALPFGQLIRFDIAAGITIPIIYVDLVAGASIPLYLFSDNKRPWFHRYISGFLAASLFSSLLAPYIFPMAAGDVLLGFLYFLRLLAYFAFFDLCYRLFSKGILRRYSVITTLLTVLVFSVLLGFVQYFWFPDLTSLKYIGWDDHLFRLTGTYLDPGFMGIILVIGFLITVDLYFERGNKLLILISAFFLIATFLTYSRASYFALILAATYLAWSKKHFKFFVVVFMSFLLAVPLLPRPKSEGVRLERSQSVFARATNYRQTLLIIGKSPLFGIGYNNLCAVRLRNFGGEAESHACGGSDSSLLYLVATTGLVGLTTYLYLTLQLLKNIRGDLYGNILKSGATALFGHSFFVNSAFYPFIMGIFAILLALAVDKQRTL